MSAIKGRRELAVIKAAATYPYVITPAVEPVIAKAVEVATTVKITPEILTAFCSKRHPVERIEAVFRAAGFEVIE